ncbi:MAG TPA: prepilin peptidase [Elusimicrobiota bacterium]|nr:prepilin peptidase [Elusimicrobiota bacterium]
MRLALRPHGLIVWAVFTALWLAISSYDWKHHRIPNRVLLFSLFPAAAIAALVWAQIPREQWLLAILGLPLAVSLWMLRVWPAGDAKLFALLAVYLPLLLPDGLPLARLSVVWLANIFVPAAAALLAESLWRSRRASLELDVRAVLHRLRIWLVPTFDSLPEALAGNAFILLWWLAAEFLYQQALARWGQASLWIPSLVLLVAAGTVHRFLATAWGRWAGFLAGFALLLWMRSQGAGFSWAVLAEIGARTLLMQLVLQLLFDALEEWETLLVPPALLEPRMVLTSKFAELLGPEFEDAGIGPLYRDGLSAVQVRTVKDWCATNRIEQVGVYRCYAFAFWLFVGTALTAVLRQDLVSCLRRLL